MCTFHAHCIQLHYNQKTIRTRKKTGIFYSKRRALTAHCFECLFVVYILLFCFFHYIVNLTYPSALTYRGKNSAIDSDSSDFTFCFFVYFCKLRNKFVHLTICVYFYRDCLSHMRHSGPSTMITWFLSNTVEIHLRIVALSTFA